MPLLKKVINTPAETADQTDALFGYCSAFSPSMSWVKARPIVIGAELNYIEPELGTAFYQELVDAYEAESMTAAQEELVRKLQPAVAWFTFCDSISTLAITVGDVGAGEHVTKEGTFVGARQWVSRAGQIKAFRIGHMRLAEALRNLDETADSHPTWKASSRHYDMRAHFFSHASDLAKYMPGGQCSHQVFRRIKPHLSEAEIRYIRPVIGEELFTEIRNAVESGSLSTEQTELLHRIRRAVGHWVIKMAMPALRLVVNEGGMVEPAFETSIASSISHVKKESVDALWVSTERAGRIFLDDLASWLRANSASFPSYAASATYLKTIEDDLWEETNDNDSVVPFW